MTAGSPRRAKNVLGSLGVPPLEENTVHVWVVNVASAPQVPDESVAFSSLSSPSERERAAGFKRPLDSDRYLVSHGVLRWILAGYVDGDPGSIAFTQGEWGKPFIESSSIRFNLSHSESIALVAVANDREVGVDVERHRELAEIDDIAAHICSARERHELDSLAPADRQGAFLAMWTRKEALAKLTGEGARALANDACLTKLHDCRFEHLSDLSGYAACVAAQGTDWRLVRCAPALQLERVP